MFTFINHVEYAVELIRILHIEEFSHMTLWTFLPENTVKFAAF